MKFLNNLVDVFSGKAEKKSISAIHATSHAFLAIANMADALVALRKTSLVSITDTRFSDPWLTAAGEVISRYEEIIDAVDVSLASNSQVKSIYFVMKESVTELSNVLDEVSGSKIIDLGIKKFSPPEQNKQNLSDTGGFDVA